LSQIYFFIGFPMHHDLARNTLAVFFIVGLIALSLWVLRPFLAATVWATMIVVATWPWLKALQKVFGGRRGPAVTVMTIGMLLLLVLPLWWAISTIVERSDQVVSLGKNLATNGLPLPPDWIKTVPLIGSKAFSTWTDFVAGGAAGLLEHVTPYAAGTGKWVLTQFGGLGGMLIQFVLAVAIAAILYTSGEDAARMVRSFGRRLAGERFRCRGNCDRSDFPWRGGAGCCRCALRWSVVGFDAHVVYRSNRTEPGVVSCRGMDVLDRRSRLGNGFICLESIGSEY
jgi:predicted PurR-regulated permease PerM